MTASTSKPLPTIGFLTVIEHTDHGLFGGFLLLNTNGRPLEFHCTAPVRSNRAQEILYGPTLKPYLYAELIGQTLLSKARNEPNVVFTDVEPMLSVREFTTAPLVLVLPPSDGAESDPLDRLRATAHSQLRPFTLGRQRVAVTAAYHTDQEDVVARWQATNSVDLLEPFSRIREAIEEAQRTARPAAA